MEGDHSYLSSNGRLTFKRQRARKTEENNRVEFEGKDRYGGIGNCYKERCLETEWENFRREFVETAKEICGRISGKKKDKETRWWKVVMIQVVRRKNLAQRRWRKTRKEDVRQNYIKEKF